MLYLADNDIVWYEVSVDNGRRLSWEGDVVDSSSEDIFQGDLDDAKALSKGYLGESEIVPIVNGTQMRLEDIYIF